MTNAIDASQPAARASKNAEKPMSDQSMLWGMSLHFWDVWGVRALIGSAILGGVTVLVTFASAYILYRVADQAQVDLKTTSETHEVEIARANERAAEANAKALEARLALERFKAPRSLTDSEAAAIVEAVRSFEGQTIGITTYWDAKEPRAFADQLLNVLLAADWKYIPPERATMLFGGIEGIKVFAHKDATSAVKARDALVSALKSAGVSAEAKELAPNAALTSQIEMTVGLKPQAN